MQVTALLVLECESVPETKFLQTNINISLAACGVYWAFWIHILPYFGHYRIRQEQILLDDEVAKTNRMVRIPITELEMWDATHDVAGKKIESHSPIQRKPFHSDSDIDVLDEKGSSM